MSASIIVAMNKDRVIGKGGTLPWHLPADLRHFKDQTLGHSLVMGRKTYESIGRPLPHRQTIVMSRTMEPIEGVTIVRSLPEAMGAATGHVYIAGGGDIYRQAMAFSEVSTIIVSHVDVAVEGDDVVRFPEIDPDEWEVCYSSPRVGFRVEWYRRQH